MRNKWLLWIWYWTAAICVTYGALYLGHWALGKSRRFQDLWDHALASGTGMIAARFLLEKFGVLNTASRKEAKAEPPVA